jgi:hypothetical protein
VLAQNQTWQVPTLAWQRGGTFLDQRDLKHQPLDGYVPAHWRDVTWRRFTDEMMPELLRDPLALRQEYFARNLHMVGALHHAGVPFMAGTDTAPGVYIMPGFRVAWLENIQTATQCSRECLRDFTSEAKHDSGWFVVASESLLL